MTSGWKMLPTCWRTWLTYRAKIEKCLKGEKTCQTPSSDTWVGINNMGWEKAG